MFVFARTLAVLLPWLGLALYAIAIYVHYAANLDKSLVYKRPAVHGAVEDVLGFGFWPTWFIVAAFIGALSAMACSFGTRKIGYLVAVGLAFVVLSLVDYYLYGVLAPQVLR